MPHIDAHQPGEFSWIELSTTDQTAAKSFYSNLFGWAIDDMPMGPTEVYTIFKLENREAAAGYTMSAAERQQGVPPHWNLYISVQSADDAGNKASQLGGKVLAPAFDVMDAGRMAVIQDPTGGVFCAWQAKNSQGTGITGVDGTLCWADLSTPDPEGARKFYADMFGWKIFPGEKDPSGYLHIQNGKDFIGGIPPAGDRNPQIPAHWLPYFLVSNVDAIAGKAKDRGAAVHLAPLDIENVGRMAVLADPQGAVFAIFTPSRA